MASKNADISANLFDAQFSLDFCCCGAKQCRHALCETMPPVGTEDCTYSKHGACNSPDSQLAAIEALRKKLVIELKRLKEDLNAD